MATLKQQIIDYLFLDEAKAFLSKSDHEKAYVAFLKSSKLKKENVSVYYFKNQFLSVQSGNARPTSFVSVAAAPQKTMSEIELVEWKPKNEKVAKDLFDTWKTGKGIDVLLSSKGGATKATTFIIHGGPGTGKTTLCADAQKQFQDMYPNAKIACVQSEMKRFDLLYEFTQNDLAWMGDLNYLILKDYGFENIKNTLIKIFQSGYDILFLDSIEDVVSKLCTYADMSSKEAEHFILELMDNANDAKNNQGVHTTVFAIQQETKGGEFKGDNKLKHMTTGMLAVRKDVRGNRYIAFSKNRRCGGHVDKKLFFDLNSDKDLVYDLKLFEEGEEQSKMVKETKAMMTAATENFNNIFKKEIRDAVGDENEADGILEIIGEEEEEETN